MSREQIQEMVWCLIWMGIESDDISYFVSAALEKNGHRKIDQKN